MSENQNAEQGQDAQAAGSEFSAKLGAMPGKKRK